MTEILLNGALGEPFSPYRDDKKLITAESWAPWWLTGSEDSPTWKNRQPVFSSGLLDGRDVQQLATPFATHIGGLWQQVPAAPGNQYELTVEGQAWSSEDAAPATRLEASDVNLQIGLDPTGGTDPQSPLIVWSEAAQPLSHWQTLHLTTQAETAVITVFLKSAPNLPKRQQSVFWRNAFLRPMGSYKRSINIVGTGDTHIKLEPEHPQPEEPIAVTISSTRHHPFTDLWIQRPDETLLPVKFQGFTQDEGRFTWRYTFMPSFDGLYEIRFVGDKGARLLALRLLQVAREVQLVPSARLAYKRTYVLLPPTADLHWFVAAAQGSFIGRYTVGFSADDAGLGELEHKRVIAVNPHHWPEVLTAAWFQQHYPGTKFTAVVAEHPEDLETWLKTWLEDGE